ncbi:hypothetical protein GCM10009837_53800 [Streptomyces durmitorensis]|uniref:Uncharacterized protein n=1 Tax=Streptomyces durmitorensis TaxID=319947 RepID=A0ABY4PXT7_9ACTN|nr:hypothetical protein [Streptomyces durmitorensis]UQT58267.1 hypothetical protein M4V62_26055 [Streptomyces durmitorensis]
MSDYHVMARGRFVDDNGTEHELVPSSVISAVPAAREAAEAYGRAVRFDFLDDRAVHWLMFQRRRDTEKGSLVGCFLAVPLFVFGVGAWPFWDLVASLRPRPFQIAFFCVDALLLLASIGVAYRLRGPDAADPTLRNMRCRVRLYRKIVGIARRGGADIPRLYPYYGMYATSRKFFPEAPELPIPPLPESNGAK